MSTSEESEFQAGPPGDTTMPGIGWILWPLAIVIILTVILGNGLDMYISSRLYSPDVGWLHSDSRLLGFLYDYGVYPAALISLCGLGVFVASYAVRRFAVFRKAALFLFLAAVLGPGLVVNAVLKDYWGRPRPNAVEQFGGTEAYRPPWSPDWAAPHYGFPSGHASMGFLLGIPFFLCLGRSRRWGRVFLAAGLTVGTAIGISRVANGGHFASDVLWSAASVYLTGFLLHHFMFRRRRDNS